MLEILKPTQDKIGLGHLFKKRDFYPEVFEGDFKGKLVINQNPCVVGSNEQWEAQYLYVCREKLVTSPTQGKYYVAKCENKELNEKIFKFVSYYNDLGLINICINGENMISTVNIFDMCFEIAFTTDGKLINDGVEKVDEFALECYVREMNEINYKPQEPVSDEIKQLMRPYMLQLIHDVSEYVENTCIVGAPYEFDLDKWIDDNIK